MVVEGIVIKEHQWSYAGIPHIGGAQNNYLRAFWTLITLASLGMFCYMFSTLISKFIDYPSSVQTTVRHTSTVRLVNRKHNDMQLSYEKLVFPAVTICQQNPVMKSLVPEDDEYYDLNAAFSQVRNNTEKVQHDFKCILFRKPSSIRISPIHPTIGRSRVACL